MSSEANFDIDHVVREIYSRLLVENSSPQSLGLLIDCLRPLEQVAVVEAIFRDIQKKFFSEDPSESGAMSDLTSPIIASVAALCKLLVMDRPFLREQIMNWLSKGQGGSIYTVGLRRAILSTFNDCAGEFLEECLKFQN